MFRPARRDLTVGVAAPARTSVGARTTWHVVVTNTGARTSDAGWLDSSPAGFEPVTVAVPRLEPGARTEVVLERLAIGRAGPGQQEIHLVRPSPFLQLMRPPTGYRTAATVVHPALVAAGTSPPGAAVTAAPGGAPSSLGVDLHGVREWRRGDATRDVHWRSTARRGRLVVAERELPQSPRLALLVVGPASSPGWEEHVSLVASAAVEALAVGSVVALVVTEAGVVTLVEGRRTALLDAFAALRDPVLPTDDALRRAATWAGRGGDLVLAAAMPPRAAEWDRVRAVTGPSGVRLAALSSHPAVPV
jgi:uncharacterized protein (DUF58 family)